jgi:hypothetical protein
MTEGNKTLTTPEGYTITFRERESVEIGSISSQILHWKRFAGFRA